MTPDTVMSPSDEMAGVNASGVKWRREMEARGDAFDAVLVDVALWGEGVTRRRRHVDALKELGGSLWSVKGVYVN